MGTDGYYIVAEKLREIGAVRHHLPTIPFLFSLNIIDVRYRSRRYVEFVDYTEEVGSSGLYFFVDFTDEISYVGMSKNVVSRMKRHEKLDGGVYQICFWLMPFKSQDEIRSAEAFIIKSLGCAQNKALNNRRFGMMKKRNAALVEYISRIGVEESV